MGRRGYRIWFNRNLILQLNFVPGEEDVRQKRININNMFPSTLKPSKLPLLLKARQIVTFSLVQGECFA